MTRTLIQVRAQRPVSALTCVAREGAGTKLGSERVATAIAARRSQEKSGHTPHDA